jgi:hypothetical protein
MLCRGGLFAPQQLPNDVFAFAAPIDDGHVSMIALDDLAFYVDWIFSNPDKSAGIDLAVGTEDVYWDNLVKTFTEVTGFKAVHPRVTPEQYFVTILPRKLLTSSHNSTPKRRQRLPTPSRSLSFKTSAASGQCGATELSKEITNISILFTRTAFRSSRGCSKINMTESLFMEVGH